ncbi:hypothetical protein DYB32_002008 [Aphanomyces invadans]|uniref:Alpha-N-acetylglucosaminidase C-terminal domain-containing protein n=1 Tax=Aphanomyces invadans TaxID=157072 RepID=A0A3R6WR52_9STRA|nr:hypothetical protein DYB32_002008 [Aphanomyces invadans]
MGTASRLDGIARYQLPHLSGLHLLRRIDGVASLDASLVAITLRSRSLFAGINMPLAFTGQEKVWQATFAQFNVTDLTDFFAGAAFLAWGRMGNIQGSWVKGPLPQSFIDDQFALQQKILARMEAFGMMPALPAFAGHIPTKLVELYPQAKVVRSDAWAGFRAPYTQVYLLDPTDALFVQLGAAFLKTYQAMYKFTAHVYQTDTYNEMDPRLDTATYLAASSSAVLRSMQDAVWLMQGWLFSFSRFWTLPRIEHYLAPLPYESLIVLDLYAEVSPMWEKSREFFHHQWIYCVLHNFGGSLGMRGDLETVAAAPVRANSIARAMVGVGLTMEGIFQNYVVYDLALHMPWAPAAVNVTQYVREFALARYNVEGDRTFVERAWNVLRTSVYDVRNAYGGVTKDIVCLRPRWHLVHSSFMPTELRHDPRHIQSAWELFLGAVEASPSLERDDAFTHDLIDITRQAMSDGILKAYESLQTLVGRGGATLAEVTAMADALLERMTDLDMALNTHPDFMLGPWIADARALARPGDTAAASYFEYEARNQITRWGHDNHNVLTDYAAKEWGGLVASYYVPRWRLWAQELHRSWAAKEEMAMPTLMAAMESFELDWQVDTASVFPTTAQGNPVQVSIDLYEKYVGKLNRPPKNAPFTQRTADPTTARHRLDYSSVCILDCLW